MNTLLFSIIKPALIVWLASSHVLKPMMIWAVFWLRLLLSGALIYLAWTMASVGRLLFILMRFLLKLLLGLKLTGTNLTRT